MPRPLPALSSARRRALAAVGAVAVAAALLPVTSPALSGPASAGAPSAAPSDAAPTPAASGLTAETFADPPSGVRPMYRWWMPLAYTEDEELRTELRDIAASGGGGVEISPFIVPGAGNQTNAFLAQYGWGTPTWAHKMEVITDEAARLGLTVDQNLGPMYPATVPSLNSFNQPEAEQQLRFGREFNAPGTTRTGALPAPATPAPQVSTTLCEPAAAGTQTLRVASLGGLAPGDTVTVGTGATTEKVVVTGLGDRTATCAELSVSAVREAHAVTETVVNVARSTRIKTLVAQCVEECGPTTTGTIALVPESVADVTAQVAGGNLTHTFDVGNGHPWVVIDFLQTASGLIAQSGGYTATQPNYVVDHWSRGGARIQNAFWDDHVLTDAVRENLAKIGGGAVFEDSLELGETQKWTWNLLSDFEKLRGYDPTTLLPALAGVAIQGTHAPVFEIAGLGPKVREDYRQTMSDLYTRRYASTMQRWAEGHGLDFRAQAYGTPIHSGVAAAATGIPEGESLNFGAGNNQLGAEQNYRVLAGGAHIAGRNVISTECCAIFQGGFRSSLAGPSVPGQFGQGGDGSAVGGRYSQGLLDSIYKAYAGGVNQLVWHGYAYRDAPKATGSTGRDGGTWPGYHPWDIFGVISVNDEFGPRQASWHDYAGVNDALARTQLVLREGRATVDLGVYYEEYGLLGQSVGAQSEDQHMLGTDSAAARAGYTYDYVAPAFLADAEVEDDGGLFGSTSDQKALVLNDQDAMSVENAEELLGLARDGLRIFVVGDAPSRTPGAAPGADRLVEVVADLLAEPSVVRVEDESGLPAALAAAGVRPAVTLSEPTGALGLARRTAPGATYDFVYNRSAEKVTQDITLRGTGTPVLLDAWTGDIRPVPQFRRTAAGVTVPLRVGAHDAVILALVDAGSGLDRALPVHAVKSTADVVATADRGLALRATADGTHRTTLSNGVHRETAVTGVASSQQLESWSLTAESWTPGATPWTTTKTQSEPIGLTVGEDGTLPSWREITSPVDLSKASGVGTYVSSFTLPASWTAQDGAHLSLGDVLDSVTVLVNGKAVTVNQADRGRIDVGPALRPGENTIEVRVATTMFNAVRATGDSNYQMPAWQDAGLIGPVVLTPYRDVAIATAPDVAEPPAVGPAVTTTKVKVPQRVKAGKRAKAVVLVSSASPASGTLRVRVDGRLRRSVPVVDGRAVVRLPRMGVGRHRIKVVFEGSSTHARSKDTAVIRVVRRR